MKFLSFFLCSLVFLVSQVYGQNRTFTILFYNTENFFDCENDTTKSDEEYLANADRNWTPQRFHLKAERLAKVIVAAGKWDAPLLVGLCEIENRDVLEALVKTDPLTGIHYKIIQQDSPDPRGIEVALLYRSDLFHPFDYKVIPVNDTQNPKFRTRDILKVVGTLGNNDTLTVYVNHWPSRYGGIMETQRYRAMAARILRAAIDNDLSENSNRKIVCMGDFNDTPTDQSIDGQLEAKPLQTAKSNQLINLSANWLTNDILTIKSKYRWEIFDQFIVSSGFMNSKHGILYLNAEIFKESFLLEKDFTYGGVKPKRTYQGFKYHNGFSDHLPIVLHFQLTGY